MIVDGLRVLQGSGTKVRLAVFDETGELRPIDIDKDVYAQQTFKLSPVGLQTDTVIADTLLKSLGQLIVTGVGPHAIGGATNALVQLSVLGTFVGGLRGVQVTTRLQPSADSAAFTLDVEGTIDEAASGTHIDFGTAQFRPIVINAGAAALTNASTLKIAGAPTGATNNYALWSAAGLNRFGGDTDIDSGINIRFGGTAGVRLRYDAGADALFFFDGAVAERMRLTRGGILTLGTAVTTGAAAGHLVLANTAAIRFVNLAGTSAIPVLNFDTNNDILVGLGSGGGHRDIRLLPDTGAAGGVVLVGGAIRTSAAAGDLVLANAKALRFVNAAGTSVANIGLRLDSQDNLNIEVPAVSDIYNFRWAGEGTSALAFQQANGGAGILFATESSADHAAPAANQAVLYTKDDGAGKTQIVARFATGAVRVVATEP